MSQEQALQDPSSSAQQGSHSDDADLYPDYAPTTPPMTPPSTPPSTPPMTPVTTAISPELKGNPNRLDRDSIIETLGGGTTKKSVRTGKNGQPQSSSEQVVRGANDDDDIKSIEQDDDTESTEQDDTESIEQDDDIESMEQDDDIDSAKQDDDTECTKQADNIESIEQDDTAQTTIDDMNIEDDDEVLEYTQPPPTITPKTRFTEVFFAPQGDPALIPPVPGRESQYHARAAGISELATTEPRRVPHDLYWKILRSGSAELPVGPGVDGFHPSVRDLVETQRHVQRATQASMAEKIRNFMKAVAEKDAVIEELKQTLLDPDAAAQSTEIGTLKGSNKYLEDQIRSITFHFDAGKARYAAELEELQADIRTANKDKQRALVLFEQYEAQIAAKDEVIVELRAPAEGAAPDGTIESPTNESGIIPRVNSVKVLQQTVASHEGTITHLQSQIIKYRTQDMTKPEADSVDKTLRAEYARDKLKMEVKELKAEVDEQRATIALCEESLQDQEAQIQRLQLEKAQHAQEMGAAEKRITEYTSRELTLTREKTSLGNRVTALNEALKNRSIELKESDQQLTHERERHAVTIIESARLKDEIQKVTHERTMLKRSLAQAGDWEQEKYTLNLTSEELKHELAALREDTARMADTYRFQIENLEVTTRLKIKNERKEATRKRRKVQEELVALRGRALTNPSGAESELDLDSAGAVNKGKSLEEELYGSSGPGESSAEEEAAGVLTNDDTNNQASPTVSQDHPLQNHLPRHSKHYKHKNAPQSEDDTISSAEDEKPNGAGRLRSRPLVGLSRSRLTQEIEISRVGEQNITGTVRTEGDSPVFQQSISYSDNEIPRERESKAHQQRLPNLEAPLRPKEGSKAPQQRLPILNEQALKEDGFGTRHRKPPILNGHVPAVRKPRRPSPIRLDMNDHERPMTDWVRNVYDANGPPQFGSSVTESSIEPLQRPGRNAVRVQTSTELSPPQDQHETPVLSGARSPLSDVSEESNTETTGEPIRTDWARSLKLPQEQHGTANQRSDGQERPTTAAGGLYETSWVRSLKPPQENADPDSPPVPPSDIASTETDEPQEPERAGNRDPEPPSSSSSAPSSSPPGGGGGGLRDRRSRAPVIIPVYERIPYRQGILVRKWEPLVWSLVLLSVLALFLMFMSLRAERQRWLAANDGTRQMLFSVERRGPVGTGLLTWLFDNAFLNVETTSYG